MFSEKFSGTPFKKIKDLVRTVTLMVRNNPEMDRFETVRSHVRELIYKEETQKALLNGLSVTQAQLRCSVTT